MSDKRSKPSINSLVLFVVLAGAATAHAANSAPQLRFENHRFTPQTLTVPAGQPLIIKVENASKETIEFESFKLNREKAIWPGQSITVHLPALSPGSYDFYDDFHPGRARRSDRCEVSADASRGW